MGKADRGTNDKDAMGEADGGKHNAPDDDHHGVIPDSSEQHVPGLKDGELPPLRRDCTPQSSPLLQHLRTAAAATEAAGPGCCPCTRPRAWPATPPATARTALYPGWALAPVGQSGPGSAPGPEQAGRGFVSVVPMAGKKTGIPVLVRVEWVGGVWFRPVRLAAVLAAAPVALRRRHRRGVLVRGRACGETPGVRGR